MTFKVSDFQVETRRPEALSVGQLNTVVRALREELFLALVDGRRSLRLQPGRER